MIKSILLTVGLALLILNNQAQTVTDIDGNVYNIITIGTQEWLKENLKTTHYCNGDPIPLVIDSTIWSGLTTGAYCNYENDTSNATIYGRLFNWYAVNDNRKIAPIGWHVATDAEWTALTDYLGGLLVAGGKLKEVGTIHWLSPNVGATNEVDYTALPGGIIERNGEFRSVGLMASWWCSTESSATDAWGWGIFNDAIHVDRGDYYDKKIGFSVRCVKDATTSNNDHIFNNSIQIYPNPAIDRIYIKCSKIQVTEVKVYNLIGICVLREGINSGTTEISLVSLAAGSYIIELINADWAIQRKLIKK